MPTSGATGYCGEYAGSAGRQLPMAGRLTLCNLSIEMGARGGMVAPDETTFKYLKGREYAPKGEEWDKALAYWKTLKSDDDAEFDKEVYFDAAGGAIGNKYYVSMRDVTEQWNLFVFDTAKRMWHKEDNLHAAAFCACKGELYCIDDDAKNIITMLGSGEKDTAPVSWEAETGNLGISTPDMKYLSGLTLRLSLAKDSKLEIYAQYDLSSEWLHLCTMFGTDLRSFTVPIRPRRTDHFKLRFVGEGEAKLYSLT